MIQEAQGLESAQSPCVSENSIEEETGCWEKGTTRIQAVMEAFGMETERSVKD